jgi:hypothetical protein
MAVTDSDVDGQNRSRVVGTTVLLARIFDRRIVLPNKHSHYLVKGKLDCEVGLE